MVSYAMYKGSSPLPAIQDCALPGYPGRRSLSDKWGCSSNGRASALQAENGLQTVQEGRRAVLVLPGTLFCHACVSKADHTRNRRDP